MGSKLARRLRPVYTGAELDCSPVSVVDLGGIPEERVASNVVAKPETRPLETGRVLGRHGQLSLKG